MDDCKFRMVENDASFFVRQLFDAKMQELQKWLDAVLENRAMFDRVCKERIFYTSIEVHKKLTIKAAYERCGKRWEQRERISGYG